MVEYPYWVWLSLALIPGTDAFAKLRASFSSVRKIYEATEAELIAVLGERKDMTIKRLMNKRFDRVQKILDYVHINDIGMLVYDDPKFPKSLKEIKNPPAMLYYKGTLPNFDHAFFVSVVGSREHSDYTKRMTYEIGYDLARGGATLVSGMAKGLDSIALTGALAAGGKVIAVLGSGIDIIYPKEHVYLSKVIASHGVVMTEFPPATPPYGHNFPIRNRIMSALGHAVLVTGGREKSGALITADVAKEQGKVLFALPGNVDDPYCVASDMLLREGAKPALCADDILSHFECKFKYVICMARLLPEVHHDVDRVLDRAKVCYTRSTPIEIVSEQTQQQILVEEQPKSDEGAREREEALSQLCEEERLLYERIPKGRAVHMDELVGDGLTAQKVMSKSTMLEVKGLIKFLPGGRIIRVE